MCPPSAPENVTLPSPSSFWHSCSKQPLLLKCQWPTLAHTPQAHPSFASRPESLPRHFPSLPGDTIPNSGSAGAGGRAVTRHQRGKCDLWTRSRYLPLGRQRRSKPGKGAPRSGTQLRAARSGATSLTSRRMLGARTCITAPRAPANCSGLAPTTSPSRLTGKSGPAGPYAGPG